MLLRELLRDFFWGGDSHLLIVVLLVVNCCTKIASEIAKMGTELLQCDENHNSYQSQV